MRLVYGELRHLAAAKLALERPGQTLQATALFYEAWLRLAGEAKQQCQTRQHFFTWLRRRCGAFWWPGRAVGSPVKHGGHHEQVLFDKIELPNTIRTTRCFRFMSSWTSSPRITPQRRRSANRTVSGKRS